MWTRKKNSAMILINGASWYNIYKARLYSYSAQSHLIFHIKYRVDVRLFVHSTRISYKYVISVRVHSTTQFSVTHNHSRESRNLWRIHTSISPPPIPTTKCDPEKGENEYNKKKKTFEIELIFKPKANWLLFIRMARMLLHDARNCMRIKKKKNWVKPILMKYYIFKKYVSNNRIYSIIPHLFIHIYIGGKSWWNYEILFQSAEPKSECEFPIARQRKRGMKTCPASECSKDNCYVCRRRSSDLNLECQVSTIRLL